MKEAHFGKRNKPNFKKCLWAGIWKIGNKPAKVNNFLFYPYKSVFKKIGKGKGGEWFFNKISLLIHLRNKHYLELKINSYFIWFLEINTLLHNSWPLELEDIFFRSSLTNGKMGGW